MHEQSEKRCFSGEERVKNDIQYSKYRENLGKSRENLKNVVDEYKKGHQKFLPRKWKFFPQKRHSEILGPPKKISVPPKLGARSPPLSRFDYIRRSQIKSI